MGVAWTVLKSSGRRGAARESLTGDDMRNKMTGNQMMRQQFVFVVLSVGLLGDVECVASVV